MAGEIGWKTVEFQIEALVPGILLVFESKALASSWFGYQMSSKPWMPTDSFIKGVVFVAASYSIGLLSSVVSRSILDWLRSCFKTTL